MKELKKIFQQNEAWAQQARKEDPEFFNRLSSVLQIAQKEGSREEFGGRATVGFAGAGVVLDGPIKDGNAAGITPYLLVFIGLVLGQGILQFTQSLLMTLAGQRIMRTLRLDQAADQREAVGVQAAGGQGDQAVAGSDILSR